MSVFHIVILWLHLLGAIAWIGGMIFLSCVLAPLVRNPAAPSEFMAVFRSSARRFRIVVWIAVALLVSTGFRLLHDRGLPLTDLSLWPPMVRAKVILVAMLLTLTMLHDLVLGPRMREFTARAEAGTSPLAQALVGAIGWLPRAALFLALAVVGVGLLVAHS